MPTKTRSLGGPDRETNEDPSIGNAHQVDRGYERIDERLRWLGARGDRVLSSDGPRRARLRHPLAGFASFVNSPG